MNHVLYGLIEGHKQRRALGQALKSAPAQGTLDIDLAASRAAGIRALVFDFDGVLGPHASETPLPETCSVLTQAVELFGAQNVYLLSNKPSATRLQWFSQNYPGIVCISGVRKKPYPEGLQQIAQRGPYATEEVALLDDRLMTGGLACLLAGAKFVYISKPYADFSRHPFKESFFAFLRFLERLLAQNAARNI